MQTTQCEVNLTYYGSRIKAHCQQVHGLSALRTCKLSAYVATESESPHACSQSWQQVSQASLSL
jgi:hypothetical protein